MNTSLIRLVYASVNRIAGPPRAVSEEIRRMLDASRQRNAERGVTGCLMFNSGRFAQYLEGPPEAVDALFARIMRDPRHTDIIMLQRLATQDRSFPDWSMAYVGPEGTPDIPLSYATPRAEAPDSVLALLRAQVRLHQEAPDAEETE